LYIININTILKVNKPEIYTHVDISTDYVKLKCETYASRNNFVFKLWSIVILIIAIKSR